MFIKHFAIPICLLVWQGFSVAIDAFGFYLLEMGGDSADYHRYVTRDTSVNNATLAFAIMGLIQMGVIYVCASNMNRLWITKLAEEVNDDSASVYHETLKVLSFSYLFMIKNGPQNILQYFYIEKYKVLLPAWYMIFKDAFNACIALKQLFWACNIYFASSSLSFKLAFKLLIKVFIRTEERSGTDTETAYFKFCLVAYIVLAILMSAISNLFRLCEAVKHYTLPELNRACFEVLNGRLVQSPFKDGCIDLSEEGFRYLTLIVIIISLFALFCYLMYHIFDYLSYWYRSNSQEVPSKLEEEPDSDNGIEFTFSNVFEMIYDKYTGRDTKQRKEYTAFP